MHCIIIYDLDYFNEAVTVNCVSCYVCWCYIRFHSLSLRNLSLSPQNASLCPTIKPNPALPSNQIPIPHRRLALCPATRPTPASPLRPTTPHHQLKISPIPPSLVAQVFEFTIVP